MKWPWVSRKRLDDALMDYQGAMADYRHEKDCVAKLRADAEALQAALAAPPERLPSVECPRPGCRSKEFGVLFLWQGGDAQGFFPLGGRVKCRECELHYSIVNGRAVSDPPKPVQADSEDDKREALRERARQRATDSDMRW